MSLRIVLGPMFSGKTSYAVSYCQANKALAVKPLQDNRYSDKAEISTHDKKTFPCIVWDARVPLTPNRFMLQADCVVVDEAHFFTGLVVFCEYMIGIGIDVVLVGLDGDARREPFRELLDCIPLATSVTKLAALCAVCSQSASYTRYTKIPEHRQGQIDVGGTETYQSVCLRHFAR